MLLYILALCITLTPWIFLTYISIICQPVHSNWFIPTIKEILLTPLPTSAKSPISFEFNNKAKVHNTNLLAKYNYDLEALILDHPNTELSYRSEFHLTYLLGKLLYLRHNWDRMKDFLENGFSINFRQISNEQRKLDNISALSKGNHKSAEDHLDMLRDQIEKEIELRF